jgi:cysteine desulfuration protein SufE
MIDDRIQKIVSEFKGFNDWEERYKHLINLGKELPEMSSQYKVESNLVKGCQSQVWLHAEVDAQNRIIFFGDSDASIVKGIVALLVRVYSGSTPDEILLTKPTFLESIGLKEHLSMSRANGLNSMMKQISFFAIAYKAKLAQMNK